MRSLLLATAGTIMISGSALAENFDGPFVGLSLGYAWGDIEYDYEDGTTGFGDFSEEENINGFEGGLFAGYRHRFDAGFVLGGELGYQLSNADGSYSVTVGANTARVNFDKSHQFYADLKPGYVFQENLLGYALIGYQRAEFEADVLLNGATLGSADDDFDAWRFGAGLEYMVNDMLSVRGQYHYAMYDEDKESYENAQSDTLDADESVFTLGVAYNF